MGNMAEWRRKNPEKIRAYRETYYAPHTDAPSSRQRWTEHELQVLLNWTGSDAELSAELGRSIMAIQQKRFKVLRTTQ